MFTTLSCKYIKNKKSEFVTKTYFLSSKVYAKAKVDRGGPWWTMVAI